MIGILPAASQSLEHDEQCEVTDASYNSSHVPDRSYAHSELISIAIQSTENLCLSER